MLALIFGIFGLHRYYLGKRFQGILHTILFFITFGITIQGNGFPAIMIPGLLGFMDAVLLAVMPKQDFDEKYNLKYIAYDPIDPSPQESLFDFFKSMGINKYRELDFGGAANLFLKSVEKFGDSPHVHFHLACCYSMLKNSEMTYLHLEKAVKNGLDDFQKIHKHKALEFIRQDIDFKIFVDNNYKATKTEKTEVPIEPDIQEEKLDLYASLLKLGDLKEKGLINDEEFTTQKKKILDTL